jgi:hypothetical protein
LGESEIGQGLSAVGAIVIGPAVAHELRMQELSLLIWIFVGRERIVNVDDLAALVGFEDVAAGSATMVAACRDFVAHWYIWVMRALIIF